VRIIQFQGAITLEYESQSIRAVYDSKNPDTPFWLSSDICKVLNINESWLTSRSFAKKYKVVIRGITRSKKVIDFECITTEGLLKLTNKQTRTPEIERFANWLESTALPEIKQEGSKIINDFVTIPANKEVTEIEVSTTVPTVNATTIESNSEITLFNQQEHFRNIMLEKEHLIQENLYLKSQLEDYISRLYDTEMRLDEVLRSNNQLSELANKIIK
jgi:prophage antirepressor-like protein